MVPPPRFTARITRGRNLQPAPPLPVETVATSRSAHRLPPHLNPSYKSAQCGQASTSGVTDGASEVSQPTGGLAAIEELGLTTISTPEDNHHATNTGATASTRTSLLKPQELRTSATGAEHVA